jgi:CheY-like chemotaxis protein
MHTSSIFLSHNHKDKRFARRLAADLSRWNIKVWIDEAEIMVGDSLIGKIREGLDQMDYVGAILSPNAVSSRWVQEELDIAMNQQISGRSVKVLPLVCKPCELPGFLLGKFYLDFSTTTLYKENLPKLLHRLLGRPVTVERVLQRSLADLAGTFTTPLTILIVDDNEPIRRHHSDLLRAHGFSVIETEDTEKAIAICTDHKPSLVISNMIRKRISVHNQLDDYTWPEGLRLLYALRRAGSSVGFIFLSATYAEGYIEEARKLMANAYIGREKSPEEFLEYVESAIIEAISNAT